MTVHGWETEVRRLTDKYFPHLVNTENYNEYCAANEIGGTDCYSLYKGFLIPEISKNLICYTTEKNKSIRFCERIE